MIRIIRPPIRELIAPTQFESLFWLLLRDLFERAFDHLFDFLFDYLFGGFLGNLFGSVLDSVLDSVLGNPLGSVLGLFWITLGSLGVDSAISCDLLNLLDRASKNRSETGIGEMVSNLKGCTYRFEIKLPSTGFQTSSVLHYTNI